MDRESSLPHVDSQFAQLEMFADGERQARSALEQAIEYHCRGEQVPEEIARYCRTCAVNLDRDLARSRGETPGPIRGRLEDFYERSKKAD